MKKMLFALAAGMLMIVGCHKQAQAPEKVYSVDEVFTVGDSLVNDTILVEGSCVHLCKHGGKKAFLAGNDESHILRCNAADFEAFEPECVNNTLRVKAVIRAIDIEVQPNEEQHTDEQHAEIHHTEAEGEHEACTICSTVRHYYADAVCYKIVLEKE